MANDWEPVAKQSSEWEPVTKASVGWEPVTSKEPQGFFPHAKETIKGAIKTAKEKPLTIVPGLFEAIAAGSFGLAETAIGGVAGLGKGAVSAAKGKGFMPGFEAGMGGVQKMGEKVPIAPETDVGKQFLKVLGLLPESAQAAGEKAFEKTGSPAAGAGTEALLNLAYLLTGARRGKPAAEKTAAAEPRGLPLEQGFEGVPRPPVTGTSSGVPLKLDKLIAGAERAPWEPVPPPKKLAKLAERTPETSGTSTGTPLAIDRLIAEAQQGWQVPEPPSVKGLVRDIKKAGPVKSAPEIPLEEGVGAPRLREAPEAIPAPPRPEAPSAGPAVPTALPSEGVPPKYTPANFDKDYPTEPLVIERSEVRGGEAYSKGKGRKVWEIIHFNTPFEKVFANSGRDWQVESTKNRARESLVAAVRQLSGAEKTRFGALQKLPAERQMEAAKQYFDTIRSNLVEARRDKPKSSAVQIEAPDAERAMFYRGEEPPKAMSEGGAPVPITPELREQIIGMKAEIGAEEQGGRLLVDETTRAKTPGGGEVLGRTPWVGQEWWFGRPEKISPAGARVALDKYGKGEKLVPREQRFVDYVQSVVEERNKASEGANLGDFGPGTFGMNPMLDPGQFRQTAEKIYKGGFGWANAIQNAPESARGAVPILFDYAREIQASRETAQRDIINPSGRKGDIEQDYRASMEAAYRANPRYQGRTPETYEEMASEIERARREVAASRMRRKLREGGYAISGFEKAEEGGVFSEPTLNIQDLKEESGRSLRIREDVKDLADQMVGAHDIGEQRVYARSFWGGLEAVNHSLVSWLMQYPTFHGITTAGKAAAYAVPTPSRSTILKYWESAGEAINDRETFRDMVKHGFQPFPVRAKMEPVGAKVGQFESFMRSAGMSKPYEAFQWIHRHILAETVNRIQGSFYQMRLEQLVRQAQSRGEKITPEMTDTFKTTAAQESNPIGGNVPREELNRTLYRGLGNTLFSRGLQVSTVRMLTRTIENNEIVRSYAESKGYTPEEAKLLTDRNRLFLMTALALDYAVMQTVAQTTNYATTAAYDAPDKNGVKGGHFTWDNPGGGAKDMLFPNSIFMYPKDTGEGVYISNPIRTVRDIIEYAMVPFQMAGGDKPQILENKMSVTSKLAKGTLTGSDWAGRPLSGLGDVLAEGASLIMPAPGQDLPRYAMEAARTGNSSFLWEGVKKMLDPETAIPVVLGLQPRVSSQDPTTTVDAAKQTVAEKKIWARVSRVKQMMRSMDPKVREDETQSILQDAREAGMDVRSQQAIRKYLMTEGVTKGSQRAADRYRQAHPADEIPPPPEKGSFD